MLGNPARLATSLAVVVSVAVGGCGGAAQNSTIPAELLPAEIAPSTSDAEAQVLRVRVYVGADYRARVVGWEQELEAVLGKTSGILERASGIRLEETESVTWSRSGGPLDKLLGALVAQDPGLDVDVVVGLVDASNEVLTDFDDLVASDIDARHVVIRGFHWQAESAALGSAAETLSENARDQLLQRRRWHKQSILLAHGIASLFGEPAALGSSYELGQTGLLADAGARLAKQLPGIREARERARQATLRPTDVAGALRRIDTENLAQVEMLLEANKPGVAWEILEPLLELYPDNPRIADAGCRVAYARKGSDALERCSTAASLGSKAPAVHIALGRLRIATDGKSAARTLRSAESYLKEGAKEWGTLARAYRELSLPGDCLRAAAKARGAAAETQWAQESQRRYSTNVGVEPEAQGDYLGALQAALKLVYAGDFSKATAAAKGLDTNFTNSIGGDLVRCEISMHQRSYASARRSCQAVVRKHASNSWARYLQGVAFAREGQSKEAIALLAAAIADDPTLEPAYKALGQLYRKSGDARLSALKTAYKTLFKKSL